LNYLAAATLTKNGIVGNFMIHTNPAQGPLFTA
jgi:hypothetical protein